jgi:hypothetical protein
MERDGVGDDRIRRKVRSMVIQITVDIMRRF